MAEIADPSRNRFRGPAWAVALLVGLMTILIVATVMVIQRDQIWGDEARLDHCATPIFRPLVDVILGSLRVISGLGVAFCASWLIHRTPRNGWLLALWVATWCLGMISVWFGAWLLPELIDDFINGKLTYCYD